MFRLAVLLIFALSCATAGQAAGPPSTLPDEAVAAGDNYSKSLVAAGARLQEANIEIQNEARRKSAVAQAEYEAVVRKLRDDHVAVLRTLQQKEASRNHKEVAAQIQEKIAALTFGPRHNPVQAHWQESFEAEQQQDYARAIKAISDAVSVGGKSQNTYVQLRLGWLNYLKKDYEKSIAAYQGAARTAPRAVSPEHGLMNCYLALKLPDEAIAAGKRVLARNPADHYANVTLAGLYYEKKDYSNSAIYYGNLVTLNPEDMQMWSNLAWCWTKLGMTGAAKSVFIDVLAVAPTQLSALTGYAEVAAGSRLEEADVSR